MADQPTTKKCPYCAEEIQAAAVVCKHCGRDLKDGASKVQLVQPKKQTGCVAAGCAGILGLLVIGWIAGLIGQSTTPSRPAPRPASTTTPATAAAATGTPSKPQPKPTATPDAHAAVNVTVVCQRAVKERLKSPSTADFPWGMGNRTEWLGKDRYRLASYVDSQNAFGATVRNDFVCEVSGSGQALSGWRLTKFQARQR